MALRIDDVDLHRDRVLVERFQEGDSTAFDTLYSRYFSRLKRFCLKRVGDPYEAEEIAQEAFTRAYRALPTLAGERRFYPWMTVIAGRLCVDHHRRTGRTEPSSDIDLGVVDGGQEAIVEQADFALLSAAVDRLAPRHREVLDMREHRGWTYQEIADHYAVPIGTVEALLFRARKALKREFLAVAGNDRLGGWIGVPVLGAVLRRYAAVKAKVGAWVSALPTGVAPVLGVAAVVGSAAVVGGTIGASHLQRPPAVVRMVTSTSATATGDAGETITNDATSLGVPSAPARAGAGAGPGSAAPPVAASTAIVDVDSAAATRDRSNDHVVKVDESGVLASVSPVHIRESVQRVLGSLGVEE